MKRTLLTVLGALAIAQADTRAALNFVEAVDGDLSNDNLAPTPLTLSSGLNLISGRMGRPDGGQIDRDIFTFTLPLGLFLSSIEVLSIDSLDNSFYAIASGTSINVDNPTTHLSNALIGGSGEYLDDLADGPEFGGTGLTSPVGAGTYTIWFQEAAVERNYQMAYTVVPEPSVIGSALGGVGMLFGLPRRRR